MQNYHDAELPSLKDGGSHRIEILCERLRDEITIKSVISVPNLCLLFLAIFYSFNPCVCIDLHQIWIIKLITPVI